MLITIILTAIVFGISTILSVVPDVTQLPVIDTYLVQGVSYYNELSTFFPPLSLFMTLTGFYLSYRVLMLLVKVFFGSRAPSLE